MFGIAIDLDRGTIVFALDMVVDRGLVLGGYCGVRCLAVPGSVLGGLLGLVHGRVLARIICVLTVVDVCCEVLGIVIVFVIGLGKVFIFVAAVFRVSGFVQTL